jgi:hypothetical protein
VFRKYFSRGVANLETSGRETRRIPQAQGVTGFDAIPSIQPQFKYSLVSAPFVPPKPSDWFEGRSSVYASAPDGTVWEAYCGRAGAAPAVDPAVDFQPNVLTRPEFVEPYNGFVSTPENTRQAYFLHHGYAFNPLDVFVGKRENDTLKTALFFRDVGSHTTAPHHLAIDS